MRASLIKWLNVVILKHAFSAQSDTVLEEMRNVMNAHLNADSFPIDQMIAHYAGSGHDLRFDDAAIERLLTLHKSNPDCRALLMLLRPDLSSAISYDIDHLHPHDAFKVRNLNRCDFIGNDEELKDFYADKEHWDTVPNLHLLDFSTNRHKGAMPLAQWYNNSVTTASSKAFVLVDPDQCSLEFCNFREFFQRRKELVRELICQAVVYVDHPIAFEEGEVDLDDEGREEAGDEENDRINAERTFRRSLEIAGRVFRMTERELADRLVDERSAYDLLVNLEGDEVGACRHAVLELLRRNLGLEETPRWRDVKRNCRHQNRGHEAVVGRRRDTTKYNFDGRQRLRQQEMVEAVIAKHIRNWVAD